MPPRLGINTYGYEQEKKSETHRNALKARIVKREMLTREIENTLEQAKHLNLQYLETHTSLVKIETVLYENEKKQKSNNTKLWDLEEYFKKEIDSFGVEISTIKKARISIPLNETKARLDKAKNKIDEIEEKYIKEKELLHKEWLKLQEEEDRVSKELVELKLKSKSIILLTSELSNKVNELRDQLHVVNRTRYTQSN